MARHDVYPAGDGTYWLDCQSDVLSGLNTRLVVPLQPQGEFVGGDRRLNPIFVIDDCEFVMQTHFAAAIPATLLRTSKMSLRHHEYQISNALDMLTGTY